MKDWLNSVHIGDCREVMKSMVEDGVKVQCCVTSPPYYGLRDYGTAQWEGGAETCNHTNPAKGKATWGKGSTGSSTLKGRPSNDSHSLEGFKGNYCPKCGATRIDKQFGLEKTPDEYVENMVEVFRLVWELLEDNGTLWLNLGDSYAGSGGAHKEHHANPGLSNSFQRRGVPHWGDLGQPSNYLPPKGLKPKDLIGIPWSVAFALRDDGWYLRQDIIWEKPNPMPESVTDRCTKSHEYIFLLAKSQKYYYDNEAIKEPVAESTIGRGTVDFGGAKGKEYKNNIQPNDPNYRGGSEQWGRTFDYKESCKNGCNKRSVWTVTTHPYKEAHFACFPPKLIEPMILAGSRVGDIVFDPFLGSGTTAQVAQKLGRNWIGIELNPDYERLIKERASQGGLQLQ